MGHKDMIERLEAIKAVLPSVPSGMRCSEVFRRVNRARGDEWDKGGDPGRVWTKAEILGALRAGERAGLFVAIPGGEGPMWWKLAAKPAESVSDADATKATKATKVEQITGTARAVAGKLSAAFGPAAGSSDTAPVDEGHRSAPSANEQTPNTEGVASSRPGGHPTHGSLSAEGGYRLTVDGVKIEPEEEARLRGWVRTPLPAHEVRWTQGPLSGACLVLIGVDRLKLETQHLAAALAEPLWLEDDLRASGWVHRSRGLNGPEWWENDDGILFKSKRINSLELRIAFVRWLRRAALAGNRFRSGGPSDPRTGAVLPGPAGTVKAPDLDLDALKDEAKLKGWKRIDAEHRYGWIPPWALGRPIVTGHDPKDPKVEAKMLDNALTFNAGNDARSFGWKMPGAEPIASGAWHWVAPDGLAASIRGLSVEASRKELREAVTSWLRMHLRTEKRIELLRASGALPPAASLEDSERDRRAWHATAATQETTIARLTQERDRLTGEVDRLVRDLNEMTRQRDRALENEGRMRANLAAVRRLMELI